MASDPYYAFASRLGDATRALEQSFLPGAAPSIWKAGPALGDTRRVLGQQAEKERSATQCLHAYFGWPPLDPPLDLPEGRTHPSQRGSVACGYLDVCDISDSLSLPPTPPNHTRRVNLFPCPILLESISIMLCGASTSTLMSYITAAVECALRRRRHAPNAQAPGELINLDRAIYEFLDKPRSQWREGSLLSGIQANHPDMLSVVLAALSSLGLIIRIPYLSQRKNGRSHVQLGRISDGGKYIYLTVQRLPSLAGEPAAQSTTFFPREAGDTAGLPRFQSTFRVHRIVANIYVLKIGHVQFLAPELEHTDYTAFRPALLEMPSGPPISSTEFQGPDSVQTRGSYHYKLSLEEWDGAQWWQLKQRRGNHYFSIGQRVLAEPLPLSVQQLPQPQVAWAARRSRRLAGIGPMEVERGQPNTSEAVSGPRGPRAQQQPIGIVAAESKESEGAGPSVQQRHSATQGRPAVQQQQHPVLDDSDGGVPQWQIQTQQQQQASQPSTDRAGASTSQSEPQSSQPHKKARLEVKEEVVEWTTAVYDMLERHFETHEQLDELLLLELMREGTEGVVPSSPGRLHLTSHLADLRSWLLSPAAFSSPSVAAITGMPGVGKSRIVSEIIEMVLRSQPLPEGEPPQPNPVFESIGWPESDTVQEDSSETGPPLIVYDEALPLPHLDEVPKGHPWRSREELREKVNWLCSSDAGSSLSAVPTYIGFHEEDRTSIFVELHCRTPKEKDEAMREGEAVEAGPPEEGESPEKAKKQKEASINMQKARSLLGGAQENTASLPPRADRRVPAPLKDMIHKYRFDLRDRHAALKLNRLQYRNTCKGHWGHYYKAVIMFPGPPELPMLLDTPGSAERLLPYGMDNIERVIKNSTTKAFATVLVVKDRTAASSGDNLALLEALSVPSCMAKPTDISPVPVHVHVVQNILGKEEGMRAMSKEDFFEGTHDGTATYQTLVPNKIKEARNHTEEEKQLMMQHHQAYPLFLLKDCLEQCIIAEDLEQMQEYELSGFWRKLIQQREDARQAQNKPKDRETLLKLQLVFLQMRANVQGSDSTSNESLADACGLYAEVIKNLYSFVESLVPPREKRGEEELRARMREAQGTLNGLLFSQCSTEAVSARIKKHKPEDLSDSMRRDLHALCHKGNRNLSRAMEKSPSSTGVHILVFGSTSAGPSVGSVVVHAARHVFQGYLSELASTFKVELVQRFDSMLLEVHDSAIAKLKDVQRRLYASLEARIQGLMAKMEEELQRLANSEDLSKEALESIMMSQMRQFAKRPGNPSKLDAIAQEAPRWGKALVQWYIRKCQEKWEWTLKLWMEQFYEALDETEQVLTGIIERTPGTANSIDGPHVQACKATMHTAAQLVCHMHAALTSSLGLQQLPPGNNASADGASTSAASTSAASMGHSELLQEAQEVVRQGQAQPLDFGLPSTEIDELVQEKRQAMEPLPNHEGNHEVSLPSFDCGCCEKRYRNRMNARRKVVSMYTYLVRHRAMQQGQSHRQKLLQLCGGEGHMCKGCYDQVRKMKKENPSRSIGGIWATVKSMRQSLAAQG